MEKMYQAFLDADVSESTLSDLKSVRSSVARDVCALPPFANLFVLTFVQPR